MARLSLEKVKEELTEYGISYTSGEYKNLESILNVKCSDGHDFLISLKEARRDPRCPSCTIQEEELDLTVEIIQEKPSKKQGKRILALDQATNRTGYCIKEGGKLLTYGAKETKGEQIERILKMRQWLVSMIDLWEIDIIGLEGVQLGPNVQTLITLSKLLGVLELTSYEILKTEAYIVNSSEWRSYHRIKGKNRNQKKEAAQTTVFNNYGLKLSQDVAEAICLCDYIEHLAGLGKIGWEMK